MDTTTLLVNLLVLGVVLESDLGRRKIGWFRIARPLLTLPVVLMLVGLHPAGSGNGLLLDVAGAVVGILIGLAANQFMAVRYDAAKGRSISLAGPGYAAIWIGVVGARLLFSYGSNHWFRGQLGQFLATNQVSADALTAAFIFMAFGMALSRTAALGVRGVRVRPTVRRAVSPVG